MTPSETSDFERGALVMFKQAGNWRCGVYLRVDALGQAVIRPVGSTAHAHCDPEDVRAA